MSDRIFVNSKGKAYKTADEGRTEYLNADVLRECFAHPRLWQSLGQLAKATPGISTRDVKRARELIEGGRNA